MEDIRNLKGLDKTIAIIARNNWLEKQRKQDKKEVFDIQQKIWRHNNQERVKKYHQNYYQKNKGGKEN